MNTINNNQLKEDTFLRLKSRVRYRAVGDDGVVVHMDTGRVIVINPVGLYIIESFSEPTTKSALVAKIIGAYDVGPFQAESDLDTFITELDQEKLLDYG